MTRCIVGRLYNLMNVTPSVVSLSLCLYTSGSVYVGGVINNEATNVYHWHPHKANQLWQRRLRHFYGVVFLCSVEIHRRVHCPHLLTLSLPDCGMFIQRHMDERLHRGFYELQYSLSVWGRPRNPSIKVTIIEMGEVTSLLNTPVHSRCMTEISRADPWRKRFPH